MSNSKQDNKFSIKKQANGSVVIISENYCVFDFTDKQQDEKNSELKKVIPGCWRIKRLIMHAGSTLIIKYDKSGQRSNADSRWFYQLRCKLPKPTYYPPPTFGAINNINTGSAFANPSTFNAPPTFNPPPPPVVNPPQTNLTNLFPANPPAANPFNFNAAPNPTPFNFNAAPAPSLGSLFGNTNPPPTQFGANNINPSPNPAFSFNPFPNPAPSTTAFNFNAPPANANVSNPPSLFGSSNSAFNPNYKPSFNPPPLFQPLGSVTTPHNGVYYSGKLSQRLTSFPAFSWENKQNFAKLFGKWLRKRKSLQKQPWLDTQRKHVSKTDKNLDCDFMNYQALKSEQTLSALNFGSGPKKIKTSVPHLFGDGHVELSSSMDDNGIEIPLSLEMKKNGMLTVVSRKVTISSPSFKCSNLEITTSTQN